MSSKYYRLTELGKRTVSEFMNRLDEGSDEFCVIQIICEQRAASADSIIAVVGDRSRSIRAVSLLKRKKFIEEVM